MVDPFSILCRNGMAAALVSSMAAHYLLSKAWAESTCATTICLLAAIILQTMMEKLLRQEQELFAEDSTGFFPKDAVLNEADGAIA